MHTLFCFFCTKIQTRRRLPAQNPLIQGNLSVYFANYGVTKHQSLCAPHSSARRTTGMPIRPHQQKACSATATIAAAALQSCLRIPPVSAGRTAPFYNKNYITNPPEIRGYSTIFLSSFQIHTFGNMHEFYSFLLEKRLFLRLLAKNLCFLQNVCYTLKV